MPTRRRRPLPVWSVFATAIALISCGSNSNSNSNSSSRSPTDPGSPSQDSTAVVSSTPGTTAIRFVATASACQCGSTFGITAGNQSGTMSCNQSVPVGWTFSPGTYSVRVCGTSNCASLQHSLTANTTLMITVACSTKPTNIQNEIIQILTRVQSSALGCRTT